MQAKKHYSEEFRREALRLLESSGKRIAELEVQIFLL